MSDNYILIGYTKMASVGQTVFVVRNSKLIKGELRGFGPDGALVNWTNGTTVVQFSDLYGDEKDALTAIREQLWRQQQDVLDALERIERELGQKS